MSSDEASSSCGNASPGSTQGVRHWFHCAATRVALTCCLLQKSDRAPGTVSSREWRFHHCAMRSVFETSPCLPSNPSSERTQPSCGRPPLALPRSLHLQPPPSHPPRAQADVGAAHRQRAGPHAHARMHARTLDHACSMPLGLSQRRDALHVVVTAAHRCLQREHAEHVAKLKDIHDASVEVSVRHSLARATSLGAMVRSRQRCALRGRFDCRAAVQCSSMLSGGLPADGRSCAAHSKPFTRARGTHGWKDRDWMV
jgi:hypothetical protein